TKIEKIKVEDKKKKKKESKKYIELIKEKEGEKILYKIKDSQHVVTLEIEGKEYTSESLAKQYQTWMNTGKSDVVFVIGGSNGIGREVTKESNQEISFVNLN